MKISYLSLVLLLFASRPLQANVVTSPAQNFKLGSSFLYGILAFTGTPYDVKGSDDDFDVENDLLALEYSSTISRSTNVFGQAGIILDSELDSCGGEGYVAAGGASKEMFRRNGKQVTLGGQFSHQILEHSCGDGTELKSTVTDMHLLASYSQKFAKRARFFVGSALTAKSIGKGKNKTTDSDFEFKRDDVFLLSLGAQGLVESMILRGEIRIFGENSFIFAVGTKL